MVEFEEIQTVLSSTSGTRFIAELASLPSDQLPDVIIMDVSMETPDEGIQVTAAIKRKFPAIHVIMFTISDNDDLIFEAFKAGAMGYLLKNESPSSILKAVIDVNNGFAQMSPGIARKAIGYLTRIERKTEQTPEELSPRELETINLVAKGYTYSQVGDRLHISTATVKKHMTNIFEKLQVKNKIEALLKTGTYREQI